MSTPRPVARLLTGLRFPEGPAFSPDGSLWCVELQGGALRRYRAGGTTTYPVGGEPNGAAIDAAGRVWFCDAGAGAIRRLDPGSGLVTTVVAERDGRPLFRPNDLAFASDGTLVFTCPGDSRREPTGYICAYAADGRLRTIAEGLYFPNGLAFIGGDLVVAETYRQRIWRGRWDASAIAWRDPAPWACELGGAPGPDGMAFGADGLLYAAIFGAGHVIRLSAEGRILDALPTPGARPTNCAFDPTGRLGLVVTEAADGELLSFPDLGPGIPLHAGEARP
jgi:gluconolactonase